MTEPNFSVRQRKTFTQRDRFALASFRHLLDLARVYPRRIPPELATILRERAERAQTRYASAAE